MGQFYSVYSSLFAVQNHDFIQEIMKIVKKSQNVGGVLCVPLYLANVYSIYGDIEDGDFVEPVALAEGNIPIFN